MFMLELSDRLAIGIFPDRFDEQDWAQTVP
jgi:hypothetical protein